MSKYLFALTSIITLVVLYAFVPRSEVSSPQTTPVYDATKITKKRSEHLPKPSVQAVPVVAQPVFDTKTEIGQLKKELYELSSKGVTEVLKYFDDYPPGLQRMELLNFYIEITPKDQLTKLIPFFEKSDFPEDFFAFKKLVDKSEMQSKDLVTYFTQQASSTFTSTLREVVVDHKENENLGKNSFSVAEETEKWISDLKLPNQAEWANVIYSNVIASQPAKFALEKTHLISALNDTNKQALFQRLAAKTPETYIKFVHTYSQSEKDPASLTYFMNKWKEVNSESAQKWLSLNPVLTKEP